MAKFKNVLVNFGLLLSGIVLFALPHPNFITVEGFPLLSYFAYIPLFILVRRVSLKTVWAYGLAYGTGCYCLYVYWLAIFNPVSMPVIAGMYGIYLMLAFLFMKAAASFFPKYAYFAEWVVWCAYEYLKTLGFPGFNYGVTAYSHWRWTLLIQIASVIGVFGLSAFISFSSAWFSAVICDGSTGIVKKIKNHKVSGIIWLALFIGIIVFGIVSPVDYSDCDTKRIALIQTNSDPWDGADSVYNRDLQTLKRLSDAAIAEAGDLDLVVWPETAFIPRITYHYKHRQNPVMFGLVNELLDYLDSKNVPFVIGNDDCVKGYNKDGVYTDLDYNSALLFFPGENVIPPEPVRYWKNHLVPFTEHFPFKKQLPMIYKMLEENDTHFWEEGKEKTVFDLGGLKFCTPICFEDTFGDISRDFVLNGAQAIVNMSNDAWARTASCQYQHLAMGVFRTVENRIPAVRATSSGQTVIIDPNGKVLDMAEPFTETYLICELPVIERASQTIYTKYGDYAGKFFVLASFVVLAFGIVKAIMEKIKYGKK
ncbi:MAG: apolipoprotein N-acyltransferase [Treponemataceae bacterium]|nr:apolipoprotein N-acyltransferase [Treponemataceae bacterium]